MLLKSFKIIVALSAIMMVVSCSEFAKMNGSEDNMVRFEYSKKMFEKGEYTKVVRLLEPIQLKMKATEYAQATDWMYSYAMYKSGNYEMATFLLDNFSKLYPLSANNRTAAFLAATSAYNISPEYYLDQEYTEKAITMLQRYLERFPDAENIDQIDKMVRELNGKVEKKAYEIAYNYYRLEEYQAAIVTFSNLLDDFPSTKYRENIMYYRFKSAVIFSRHSIPEKQAERYRNAVTYGKLMLKTFPNTRYKQECQTLLSEAEKGFTKYSSNTTAPTSNPKDDNNSQAK